MLKEFPKGEMQGMDSKSFKDEQNLKFAYVTFRNMDSAELVMNAYKVGVCKRKCTMCCGCCCKEQYDALAKKHLFKKWPEINVACAPDNIKWENLGYTARSRRCRIGFVWLVAFALVFASLIGIVIMKDRTTELKQKYKLDMPCEQMDDPDQAKILAWQDMQRDEEIRGNMMTCYCKPLLSKLALKILDRVDQTDFMEFKTSDTGEPDTKLYCKEWAVNYAIQNL